jgi:hypothetical protein
MFDPFFGVLFLAAIIVPVAAFVYWLRPKPRRSKNEGFILLGCVVIAICGFLYYAGPALFVSNEGIMNAYVLASPSKAAAFNDDVGAIIGKYGFSQNPGKTVYDSGLAYYVMNGTGHSLWFWSTNLPLSGQEDRSVCGHYSEAHPDPGQFELSISRIWPFGTKALQRELLAKISSDLKAARYEIRTRPVLCSPASKMMAPR